MYFLYTLLYTILWIVSIFIVIPLTPGGNGCLSNIGEGWLKAGVAAGDVTGIFWGWEGGRTLTSAPAIISRIRFTATREIFNMFIIPDQTNQEWKLFCAGMIFPVFNLQSTFSCVSPWTHRYSGFTLKKTEVTWLGNVSDSKKVETHEQWFQT